MKIMKFRSSILDQNTYLFIINEKTFIVDPGLNARETLRYLDEHKLTPTAILLTHCHFDHVSGLIDFVKKYNCPVYMSNKDRELFDAGGLLDSISFRLVRGLEYNSIFMDGSERTIKSLIDTKPFKSIKTINVSEPELNIEGIKFEIFSCPGHSKGSICYRIENYCFIGDFLFKDSVGRMDIIGSDVNEMRHSCIKALEYFQDTDIIIPGHGPECYFKEIKQNNRIFNQLLGNQETF